MSDTAAPRPRGGDADGNTSSANPAPGSSAPWASGPAADESATGPETTRPQSTGSQTAGSVATEPEPHYPEQGTFRSAGAVDTLLPEGLDPADAVVLFVHAHPDDESTSTGATMGLLARQGAQVHLLSMTRGEMGEVIGPEHAELDVRNPDRGDHGEGLGKLRETELSAACRALGVRSQRFARRPGTPGFFRDSGMAWGPDGRAVPDQNAAPDCLLQAPLEQAARAVATVIEQLAPDVVVTYDADGGYGHPDHRRTHEAVVGALGMLPPDARPALVWGLEGDPDPQDERRQAVIEGEGETKKAAMAAHRTQVRVGEGASFAYSNGVNQPISATESYRLLGGTEALSVQEGDERLAPGPVNSAIVAVGMGLIAGFVGTLYHASIATFPGWWLPWGVVLALLLVFTTVYWVAHHTRKRWAGPVTGCVAFLLVVLFAYLRPNAMLVIPTTQAAIGIVGIVWSLGTLVSTWGAVFLASRTVFRRGRAAR